MTERWRWPSWHLVHRVEDSHCEDVLVSACASVKVHLVLLTCSAEPTQIRSCRSQQVLHYRSHRKEGRHGHACVEGCTQSARSHRLRARLEHAASPSGTDCSC